MDIISGSRDFVWAKSCQLIPGLLELVFLMGDWQLVDIMGCDLWANVIVTIHGECLQMVVI